jgi:hypothetical protein
MRLIGAGGLDGLEGVDNNVTSNNFGFGII